MKMNSCVILLCVLSLVENCLSSENIQNDEGSCSADIDEVKFSALIENFIQNIETNIAAAKQHDSLPAEELDKYYNEIIVTFQKLTDILGKAEHAYAFLQAKGADRIITPNMDLEDKNVQEHVLLTLKTLFDAIPTTTSGMIPITTLDNLLELFEKDNNLAMKTHVLDILYLWLPGNPKIQVRVMKLKGLEPFYRQISKLDTSVITVLLELFNKLLLEHINVRNQTKLRNTMDPNRLLLYQRIGLIERLSTPPVCKGLLNIFQSMYSYTNDYNDVIAPVFDLIKTIRPYCMKIYKKKGKAIEVFEALSKYAHDDSKREYFEGLDLNVTDINIVLDEFIEELKRPLPKDEF